MSHLQNIMVTRFDESGIHIKLIDFGFVRQTNAGNNEDPQDRFSPDYASPDIIHRWTNNLPYNPEEGLNNEVFSLGVIAFLLATREFPFKHSRNQFNFDLIWPNSSFNVSPCLRNFLLEALETDRQPVTYSFISRSPFCKMHAKFYRCYILSKNE